MSGGPNPAAQPAPGQPAPGQPEAQPLGVAAIGYAFMGKAHSHAWRNVSAFFDVPAVEQKVLDGSYRPDRDGPGEP